MKRLIMFLMVLMIVAPALCETWVLGQNELTVKPKVKTDWTLKYTEQEVGGDYDRSIFDDSYGSLYYKLGFTNHKVDYMKLTVYGLVEGQFTNTEQGLAAGLGTSFQPIEEVFLDGTVIFGNGEVGYRVHADYKF